MPDRVVVEGLRLECVIGVHVEERRSAQEVLVDLELDTDCGPAGRSDDLAHAVDYEAVVSRLKTLSTGVTFALIEALAERIGDSILASEPRVLGARVRVRKRGGMVGAEHVGVVIERSRTGRGGCRQSTEASKPTARTRTRNG